ncbi:ribosome small subunit-dependent GTPase A [Acetivibrio cellulolyticus]|uniref:ribosome small subunit-dependent GTPase A n=1 Tax=Acetivibrio cellulolyticus TaxID=35830 RepID=UPI0001E2D8D5|nr:ribosome small subunit-dependent GTPase A [Acetivibrio cellulolyticus]
MLPGIIIKGIGGFYYVKTEFGLFECKARGIFRKDSFTPLPGDKVSISVSNQDEKVGNIEEIFPRDSQLIRPAVANVNQIAIVIAIKSPQPDFTLLDKLLITVEQKDISAVICINKIDLDKDMEYKNVAESYQKAGYRVLALSSAIETGFDELESALKDKTTAFAGQSGVGKSTILNRVLDSYVMETGKVSDRIERGRHTTRHAELIELKSGGFVVDTPGFSSFELSGLEAGELQNFYPEFRQYFGRCKFTGCMHISEPECEVKAALERGILDYGRHARYVEFCNMLKEKQRKKYS